MPNAMRIIFGSVTGLSLPTVPTPDPTAGVWSDRRCRRQSGCRHVAPDRFPRRLLRIRRNRRLALSEKCSAGISDQPPARRAQDHALAENVEAGGLGCDALGSIGPIRSTGIRIATLLRKSASDRHPSGCPAKTFKMVTWKLTVAASTIDQRDSPRSYGILKKAAAGLRPAPSSALCPDAPRIKQISKLVVDERSTVVCDPCQDAPRAALFS
jgi:hypothetical protein